MLIKREVLKAHRSTNDSQLAQMPTAVLPATDTRCQIDETPDLFDYPAIGLGIDTNVSATFLPFHTSDLSMSGGEFWSEVSCKLPNSPILILLANPCLILLTSLLKVCLRTSRRISKCGVVSDNCLAP